MSRNAEQVGLRPRLGPEAARAQHAVDRDHRHEHEADGGEMAELREVVEPVGIDHQRVRQPLVGLVMVDHDDVEAEPPRLGQRLDAGGAAIDGDEQRRAALGERADRLDVRPVALEDAVGDVDDRIEAGARAGSARAARTRSRRRRRSRRRSRRARRARRRRRCAAPPPPWRSANADRASAAARSGRGRPRPRRPRRRGRRGCAPAAPARRAAARSRARARSPRSSSRSRQGRPQTERSTPRNRRVDAFGAGAKAIVMKRYRIKMNGRAVYSVGCPVRGRYGTCGPRNPPRSILLFRECEMTEVAKHGTLR